MSTGQIFLTICAFILLSTILVRAYGLLASNGEVIDRSQANITEIALATSIQEIAQNLWFDNGTIDTMLTNPNGLTAPDALGPDDSTEVGIGTFDDFDDFHEYSYIDSSFAASTGRFRCNLQVYYVNPQDISQISSSRTFVKRMDMEIYRLSPNPSDTTRTSDTFRTSVVLGYFHFE
jgi:hypothetical protein